MNGAVAGSSRRATCTARTHHGDKLVRRFDAGSYVTLTEAMNSHDIGRDRGGAPQALRRVRAHTPSWWASTATASSPLSQQKQIAARISGADAVRVIASPHGHDAFLIETDQVAACLDELLPSLAGCDR